MTDKTKIATPEHASARDTGALLLAAGGLAAAFGAASCCALPLLLGSAGLGSAWLVTVAWFAAPHRIELLAVAIACLLASGGMFLWRRRSAATCAPGAACGRHMWPGAACGRHGSTALVTGILSVGAMLVVLGFLYA